MSIATTIGVDGYFGQHSAEIRTENRLCIEPRWQLGHLLYGRKWEIISSNSPIDPASDEDIPLVSPDGRRIAFTSERGVTHDLYVMDSDGNNVVRLTHDNFFESRASWSPDGTRIAFSTVRSDVRNSEIYVMDADGENEMNLTKHEDVTILYRVGRQMEARLRLSALVVAA